jgi:hypothetical protein
LKKFNHKMASQWAENWIDVSEEDVQDPDDGVNSWGDVLLKITV